MIVSEVDMTLMVVQPRKLPLKALLRQKQVIESVGGNLAGVVMNNVDITSDHQYQYYTTYYSYYSAESGASGRERRRFFPEEGRAFRQSQGIGGYAVQ